MTRISAGEGSSGVALRRFVRTALCIAVFVALPACASGQSDENTTPAAEAVVPSPEGRGWTVIFGEKVSRPHVALGVWALHPFEPQFPELEWTRGYGVKANQWLLATFVNSYGRRGFIAALERYWWVGDFDPVDIGIGYRAGLVTGYDERLMALAGKTPLLPFTGLLVWTDFGPFSINAFYAYRGITLETGWAFR